MFILDTDHLGILQGPLNDACGNVLKRIAEVSDSHVFTTIISFPEIVAGWTANKDSGSDNGSSNRIDRNQSADDCCYSQYS